MGRKIYLLRHGKPDMGNKGNVCLGVTDILLSKEGEVQADKIANWFRDKKIARIYTSPLNRCVRTSEIIAVNIGVQTENIRIREELHEMHVGKWENLTFTEIRHLYPNEYEARSREIGYYSPPGGECFHEAGHRFGKCLDEIRAELGREQSGNLLVVAHSGVIRGYLCKILGISANQVMELPQPYVGVSILEEQEGSLKVKQIGQHPLEYLDGQEIRQMYEKYTTPMQVIKHMKAVAAYIEKQRGNIPGNYDWELLKKSALVHDIVRTYKKHAQIGADALLLEGYESIADLVREHHSTEQYEGNLHMKEILFYADKRVQDDRIVSIGERFAKSLEKCKTKKALEKHNQQLEKAKHIEKKIENLTRGKL